MNHQLTAVIVAAGTGSRMKTELPKPFIKVGHKPLIWYSIFSLQQMPFVDKIYIVISQEYQLIARHLIDRYCRKITKLAEFITGGEKRQNSVWNALQHLKQKGECQYLAIHDAARPFLKPNMIEALWQAVNRYNAAAPGIQVVDTIKICNGDNIISHPLRENLTAIQTPQVFHFNKLYKAYQAAMKKEIYYTDDTEVYAGLYQEIKIIPGDQDLFKITYPADLKTANEISKKNRKIWRTHRYGN